MFGFNTSMAWKSLFRRRELKAYSAAPLLVYPTHYTGEAGYISDTEDSPVLHQSPPEDGEMSQVYYSSFFSFSFFLLLNLKRSNIILSLFRQTVLPSLAQCVGIAFKDTVCVAPGRRPRHGPNRSCYQYFFLYLKMFTLIVVNYCDKDWLWLIRG